MLMLSLLLALFSACDRVDPLPTGLIGVGIRPVISDDLFIVGSPFMNPEGRAFQFDNFQLYVSEIKLVREDGEEFLVNSAGQEEPVWLFDFGDGKIYGTNSSLTNDGTLRTEAFEVPAGSYRGIKLSLGVPKSFNHLDPVTYATMHPLSEFHGAFWTWNSGYIFLKIDGNIDESPEANGLSLGKGLTYHTGLDTLFREISFLDGVHTFSVTEGTTPERSLDFTLDVNKLFYLEADTIDMVDQNFTHTTNNFTLAEAITRNLSTHALRLE